MLNLLLNELKLIARNRRIKGYESMSKDKLINIINASVIEKETERIFLNQWEKKSEETFLSQ